MVTVSSNNNQKVNYWDLTPNQRLLVDSFSQLFQINKEKLIDIIDLSSKTDFHSVRAIECLSKIEQDKMINAVILLEYLLCSGDQAMEIVNENSEHFKSGKNSL